MTIGGARTTTSAAPSGISAATCPTSAEIGALVKTPPTEAQTPRTDSSGVTCDFVWSPSPASTLGVRISRWPTAEKLAEFFERDLKADQDEAAGKTLTAHKTGPGSVTPISGLGDQAYVHYEKPLDYHEGPGTYEIEARAGTVFVTIRMRDSDALRFGPAAGETAQGVEIAKLAFKKAG